MTEAVSMVGTAASYDDLRKLIDARRKALGLSQIDVDEIAGLQGGYFGKLICGMRHFGDMSLESVLGAIGAELALVVSAPNKTISTEIAKASIEKSKIHRKKFSAKGGRARFTNKGREWCREQSRKGALKRWRNWREVQAEKARKEARKGKAKPPAAPMGARSRGITG